jgi:hypothetical protein
MAQSIEFKLTVSQFWRIINLICDSRRLHGKGRAGIGFANRSMVGTKTALGEEK